MSGILTGLCLYMISLKTSLLWQTKNLTQPRPRICMTSLMNAHLNFVTFFQLSNWRNESTSGSDKKTKNKRSRRRRRCHRCRPSTTKDVLVENSLDVDQKDVHVDKPPFSANSFDIFAGFLNCKMGRGQFIREQSNVKHKN